jgi:transposase
VPDAITPLPDDPIMLQQMLREAQAEIEKLQLVIDKLLRHRYGPRSEQLSPDQLQLGLEDQEQTVAEKQAAPDAAAVGKQQQRCTAKPNRNHGALPSHLPRYEVLIDIDSKVCPCCGGALHAIGEDRTEMLDIIPTRLRVKVIRRPRYACRACEGAVVQAPAPERPIDGGMATEAMIIHVVVGKFCDGLPLYRQAQMLQRQRIALDRSTLSAWVGQACWWLTPVYELLVSTVLASDKVFADETTLPVLDPGRGKTKTGCGAMRSTTGHGRGHPIRRQLTSTRRIGEVSIRVRTSPDSEVFCRSMATQGSAAWSMRVVMGRSGWLSAGRTREGLSLKSIPPPNHRSQRKCWHELVGCMRSRQGSVVSHPMCVEPFVNYEAGRSSKTCTTGLRSTCRVCLDGQSWRRPCDTHCVTGTV